MPEQLFLAVPKAAYEGIFQAPVAQQAIHNLTIQLLVFDPIVEEVVLWGPLKDIVHEVMSGYAVKGLNGYSVLTMNADQSLLTIVSTAFVTGKRTTTTSLIARIDNNQVFIDHDINNKPLVDALVQAGIPRTQIILTYADEPIPETLK